MVEDKIYYRVLHSWDIDTSDYILHGFESEKKYRCALQNLCREYGGRVGELIDEQKGYLHAHIRFMDTPDKYPEDVWIPAFLLRLTVVPDYLREMKNDEKLDDVFGFD